jgi:hypothetical protein
MNNRIFQDPPPNIDETWTHGALLGGMIGFDEEDLAESYFDAADALVGRVRKRKQEGRDLINPILFLYRHGVELYLKAIVRPEKRNHDLTALLAAFRRHVEKRYKETLPEWLIGAVSELARYDPHSDVFRYPESRSRRLDSEGEFWVDLSRARRHMRFVRWVFKRVKIADKLKLGDVGRSGRRDLDLMAPRPPGRPPR